MIGPFYSRKCHKNNRIRPLHIPEFLILPDIQPLKQIASPCIFIRKEIFQHTHGERLTETSWPGYQCNSITSIPPIPDEGCLINIKVIILYQARKILRPNRNSSRYNFHSRILLVFKKLFTLWYPIHTCVIVTYTPVLYNNPQITTNNRNTEIVTYTIIDEHNHRYYVEEFAPFSYHELTESVILPVYVKTYKKKNGDTDYTLCVQKNYHPITKAEEF